MEGKFIKIQLTLQNYIKRREIGMEKKGAYAKWYFKYHATFNKKKTQWDSLFFFWIKIYKIREIFLPLNKSYHISRQLSDKNYISNKTLTIHKTFVYFAELTLINK